MPEGAPAALRNVITSEVLSVGQDTASRRYTTQFSSGTAHGRQERKAGSQTAVSTATMPQDDGAAPAEFP